MTRWFSNKITEITRPLLNPEQCQKSKELAEVYYTKHYPPIDFSSGVFPPSLRLEGTATREWLSVALRSNTGQDRIFAMAYLINLHPLNCLRYLDCLINLLNPAKQRDCIRAIDVLHQLFGNCLLPRHRTMVSFNSRPHELDGITNAPLEREKTLCLWLFEDHLKTRFHQFVKSLERLLMNDTIEIFKRKSLSTLSDLVVKSPENRALILSVIINKLGDRSKVFASSVIHWLRKIAGMRRNLVGVIVEEVRTFLFRPNLLERAKYYALVFLSCLELKPRRSGPGKTLVNCGTALTLVKVYSAFFHSVVKSEKVSEKLVMALLTGLSRAAPFLPESQFDGLLQEINDIFRLVHTSTFNVSLQALAVLFQLTAHRPDFRDRYYQALYRKLRDPQILHTARGPTVLYLLYRSLLADSDIERGAAFAHRLLQLCLYHPSPGFVVGAFILLSKLQTTRDIFITATQMPIGSEIFVNGELEKTNSSEDEHFSDAPDSDFENRNTEGLMLSHQSVHQGVPVASWHHRLLPCGTAVEKVAKSNTHPTGYRPNAREPLFARAGGQPSWPLISLTNHSHPTVSLFANMLLQRKPITYTGNPFDDFSLPHFLDRFAFKKPKVAKKSSKRAPPGRRLQRHAPVNPGSRAFSINSDMFRQLSSDKVAADEQFFHKYAKFLETRTGHLDKSEASLGDSDSSVSDSEFDIYLEKYEKGLIPSEADVGDNDNAEFVSADFSDDSDEKQPLTENIADEALFAAMDGISPFASKSKSFLDPPCMDVDLDSLDDDMDTDEQMVDKNSGRKMQSSSRNLDDLFVSAEEIGRLFNMQETPKERKQRLWEEKNALHHSPLKRRSMRNRSSKKEFKKKSTFKMFTDRTPKQKRRH